MAKNRMSYEKLQRDAKKKRLADEKREARRLRKQQARTETTTPSEPAAIDEASDS